MTKTVVAIYNSMNEAENAVNQLVNNGFNRDSIDVSPGETNYDNRDQEENGVSRFFKNLFGNDEKKDRYTKVAERGSVVTVYANSDEEADRASKLLDEYGAVDVDENYDKLVSDNNYREDRTYDTSDENYNDVKRTYDKSKDYVKGNENYDDDKNRNYDNKDEKNRVIPVIEEDIKVGKREVATGGVRIRSRIIEKPFEENVRLREEHIRVDRKKVDRPATEAELSNLKDGAIELTEHREVADVQKTSQVVEEVSLAKEVNHREETVRDNIRKTEVDVENIKPEDRNSIDRKL